MRKLVLGTFVTLDGVMQAPGTPDEDRDGGFEHGGWSFPYWDEVMNPLILEQMLEIDILLLGRRTYEIFAGHWPRITDPADPVAAKLNAVPKVVASRALRRADWNNTTIIRDVAAEVGRLKREGEGQIQVSGSADLIQTLLEHDLVDELRLWTFPLALGTGKRLFAGGTLPAAFRLLDTKVSTTGVVIQRLERAGPVRYGSFALEEEEGAKR
jgi:dihydrofolate reductase